MTTNDPLAANLTFDGAPASPAMLELLASLIAHNKANAPKPNTFDADAGVVYGGDMEDVF